MIKNYSLIAEKWADFFETPAGMTSFLEHSGPVIQRLMESVLAEIEARFLSGEEDKTLLPLCLEGFVAGLVMYALEHNLNIMKSGFDIPEDKAQQFVNILDNAEQFKKIQESISPVSEALLVKAAHQLGNKYLFTRGDDDIMYKEFVQMYNILFFACVAGYVMNGEK